MKNRIAKVVMIAASLMLSAGLASAVEVKATAPEAASAAKAAGDKAKTTGAKAKAAGDKAALAGDKAAVVGDKAKAAVVDTKAGAKAAVVTTKGSATAAKEKAKGTAVAAKPGVVDINTASEAELKTIPGLGDAYAAKIIAGRPYANKGQLKSRNILPEPAYEKIKDQIVAKRAKK